MWLYHREKSPKDADKMAYCNVPKISDRQIWANSVDPDQTAPHCLQSLCTFWMHYSKEKPSCSTFREITANFRVSKILGFLQYLSEK